jgi:hypothetical protein
MVISDVNSFIGHLLVCGAIEGSEKKKHQTIEIHQNTHFPPLPRAVVMRMSESDLICTHRSHKSTL